MRENYDEPKVSHPPYNPGTQKCGAGEGGDKTTKSKREKQACGEKGQGRQTGPQAAGSKARKVIEEVDKAEHARRRRGKEGKGKVESHGFVPVSTHLGWATASAPGLARGERRRHRQGT